MRTSQLLESSAISLPAHSYVYAVAPLTGLGTLAAISSDDSLRIVAPTTLQLISRCASGKVHDGVTCLRNLDDSGAALTAGRDAAVRSWDPRTGERSLEFRGGKVTLWQT